MFRIGQAWKPGGVALLVVVLAVAGCDGGPYKDFVGKPVSISYSQWGSTTGCVVKATRDGIYLREFEQDGLQGTVTFVKGGEIRRVSERDDISCP